MTQTGPIYTLDGIAPRIAPDAWIAPTAAIIGNVDIGAGASIWFGCILRGDTNLIRVGARTNIQDGSLLHCNPGEDQACLIGDDVTVGHMAIVHAATLHNGAFVETGGVLAAGAVLTPGKRIGAGELWSGTPARLVRVLSEEERAKFAMTAPAYVQNAIRFRQGLKASQEVLF